MSFQITFAFAYVWIRGGKVGHGAAIYSKSRYSRKRTDEGVLLTAEEGDLVLEVSGTGSPLEAT